MKTITFKDESQDKIDALMKIAHEMGIREVHSYATEAEEFELAAPPVGEAETDAWLTKDNGEKLSATEAEEVVNEHIHKLESH